MNLMKRKRIILTIVTAFMAVGVAVIALCATCDWRGEYMRPLQSSLPMPPETAGRVLGTNYFFEDFENPEGETGLPSGWKTVNSGSLQADCWKVGAVEEPSYSGCRCAYVEGDRMDCEHDTWFFSPMIEVSEPVLFADFYVLMPGVRRGNVRSRLLLYLCREQSADAIVSEAEALEIMTDSWVKVMRPLVNPENSGKYCLAFRCTSPAHANTLCIDDVRVSDGCDTGPREHDAMVWTKLLSNKAYSAALR